MVDCPFLSRKSEKIKCFDECPLFKYEGNDGICPFKTISAYKSLKLNNFNFDVTDQEHSMISFEQLLR